MPRICQLPPSVVNKIAAGEVIERPASVVKELVENSLDAGATRIDVSVERGGSDSIRVTDNGSGIEPADLPLAVASHATSKIANAEDLFRVATMGFRGEALASIAEVSRLLIRTRTPDSPGGSQLEVVGGEASPIEPCGTAVGTTIEVADLFFNTPVRRKFMRSTQTEIGHISEAVTRLALAYPHVHFTLRHNAREIYDLPPADPWTERIGRLFGDELTGQLIAVESVDAPIRLAGYVAHPSQSRANQRMQYLFLNRRYIRDRSLQHALGEAYRGLLLTGRYPICFLQLELPADLVDVNVHPTKLEVRFQDGGRIYSQLLGTLRTRFLSTDLTTAMKLEAGHREAPVADTAAQWAAKRAEVVSWARTQMAEWQRPAEGVAANPVEVPPAPRGAPAPLELNPLAQAWSVPARLTDDESSELATELGWPLGTEPAPAAARPTANGWPKPAGAAAGELEWTAAPIAPGRALQVHNRYLIAESEEGVVVIDQHALHERILYEQLLAKVLAGGLEAQALLVPEPVDLSPAELALVLEQRQVLSQLGISVEPFGGSTVLVSSYPAMLTHVRPAEILRGLLEPLAARTPDRRDVLDRLLHSIACKAAVKAGDRLDPEEIAALLEDRRRFRDSHHCPHGRPTELVFTREELDRQFQRI